MDREEPETKQTTAVTSPEEDDSHEKAAATEEPASPGAFQTLLTLLEKTHRNQQGAPSRRELSRDKSKSFLLLAGATIALLLIFLGVFSSPKTRAPLPGETVRGAPGLGRKTTPGQGQNDSAKTVTPMLNADVREGDNGSGSQVTPQDVGGTSPRYNQFRQAANGAAPLEKPPAGRPANSEAYALKNVDFSDPSVGPASIPTPPRLPAGESDSELKKPSIVFVRAAQSATPAFERSPMEDGTLATILPAGIRLVARLGMPVRSTLPGPVIVVAEHHYVHDKEIELPEGSTEFRK